MSEIIDGSSIYLGDVVAFRELADLCDKRGWTSLPRYASVEQVAWLVWLLYEMEDDPDLFITGKWALIQLLEDKLQAAAKHEVARTNTAALERRKCP